MSTNFYRHLIQEARTPKHPRFINKITRKIISENIEDDGLDWYDLNDKYNKLLKLPKEDPEAQTIRQELKAIPNFLDKWRKWKEANNPVRHTDIKPVPSPAAVKKFHPLSGKDREQISRDLDKKNTAYINALEAFIQSIKNGKYVGQEAEGYSSIDLANELLGIIDENTSGNENSRKAAIKNIQAIIGLFDAKGPGGYKQMRLPSGGIDKARHIRIPEDATTRWTEEKTKQDLLYHATNQLQMAGGNATIKLQNPDSHKGPNYRDPIPESRQIPLETAELIGISDPKTFEHICESAGLQILGMRDTDLLNKAGQKEEIVVFANEITEDVNTYADTDPYLEGLKAIAEVLGYIVTY